MRTYCLHCRQVVALGLFLFLGTLAGCSSLSYRTASSYQAASLPPEYRASPAQGGTNIDLTRLSMPGEPSSLIGPEDVIKITLSTGYEEKALESMLVRVNEQGVANIPLVGEVSVAGLEPAAAEHLIASTSVERGIFQRPHVTVLIEHKKTNRVTVVGAVEKPGIVLLDRSSSDLVGALAQAGGLTEEAGSEVIIHRKLTPGQSAVAGSSSNDVQPAGFSALQTDPSQAIASRKIDLHNPSEANLADYRLGDGDVVMVYEEEPRLVHIMGLVQKPQQIEIPANQNLRLLDAIAIAGGRTLQVADKVKVIRQIPNESKPIVIDVSIRQAKRDNLANLVLAPEDIVTVEETPITFVFGAMERLVRIGVSGSTPLF